MGGIEKPSRQIGVRKKSDVPIMRGRVRLGDAGEEKSERGQKNKRSTLKDQEET